MVPIWIQQTKTHFRGSLYALCIGICLFFSVIFVLAGALILSSTESVAAQTECGDRRSIVEILGDRYAEKPAATGMTKSGSIIEVFAAENGTWTMIVTMPTGHSCFMAAGEDWENIQQLVQGAKI